MDLSTLHHHREEVEKHGWNPRHKGSSASFSQGFIVLERGSTVTDQQWSEIRKNVETLLFDHGPGKIISGDSQLPPEAT